MDNEEHLPLIAFTTLTPLAVGGLIGLLWEGAGGFAPIAILGVGVLAMVASIFHLGHPARMLRSLLGVASSWLSREVALFGFFLACLAVYALGLQVGSLRSFASLLGIVAAVFGLLSLFATGKVYQLQARPAWNHWTAVLGFPLSALSGGLPLGIFLAALTLRSSPAQDAAFQSAIDVAMIALVGSVVLTALRLGRLRRARAEERESWRLASGRYLWLLVLRVAASAVAFALLVTGGPGIAAAWAAAAAGEAAERALFFNAVVPVSMQGRTGLPRYAQTHG